MGRIAFLFSGQGAQFPGMGKSFYESDADIKALFDRCEEIKSGTLDVMFNGPEDVLTDTVNAQPALYLCDLASAIAAGKAGINADAVCGFSLGELPALAFADAFSYEDGFKLVIKRASAMAKAGKENESGMAAVVKLSNEDVEKACEAVPGTYPVNYNCQGQVSVSLRPELIEPLSAKVREMGGRVIPLKVSGGFHSPYMDTAAEEFAVELDKASIGLPKITAYSNVTARPYKDEVKETLKKQINSPVRWEDTIKDLAGSGFDTFIETGVGTVLQKLVMKILPEAKTYAISDVESLETVKKELSL